MDEMSEKHPLDRAAAAVDGVGKLAAILDVSASAICNWKKRGVPIDRCVAIERATAGAVGRRDLRPVDWADHWPELVEQTPPLAGGTPHGLPLGITSERRDLARPSRDAGADWDRRSVPTGVDATLSPPPGEGA